MGTEKELETRYDPKGVEAKWYQFWEEKGYFRAQDESDRAPFSIVIPPPNVTGDLHMGHALNDAYQDILTRWRRMQGREALWIPGTDHAGIATQNVVEKELRKEGKKRQDLGREAFVERVHAWKADRQRNICDQLRKMGMSCDWDRERFTLDDGLSRAVQEVFIRLYKKGLVYRGEYLVNWCPRCGTALSDEEAVSEEIEGGLYRIRYPLEGEKDRYVTVATTRPETMLGDTAVAVHPEDERYKDIIGKCAVLPFIGRKLPIIAETAVDRAFGTGCLKVTPAHDPNDFEIGNRHGLPRVNVFHPDATVNVQGGEFQGMDRFEAREAIVSRLQALLLLESKEPHRHNVPHCYRCRTIVEPYLSWQWFVKMKPLAEPAIRAAREGRVRFTPERWAGVYYHWMENIRDWCISRQLWWGHRIPVWYCAACKAEHCDREPPAACHRCGSKHLEQDQDVLDTWFSSWLWPFSTMGWPAHTKALRKFYPTSVLVTGHEIIFFWVARMIMAGIEFMGKEPFRDVYIHGIVRDEQGRKMSKSLGNGIDPRDVIENYSADALRFSLMMLTTEGQDVRLSEEKFEMGRNFSNKLWNASRLVLKMLEGHDARDGTPVAEAVEDRWVLSRLHATIEGFDRAMEAFRFNEAVNLLYDFVWKSYCDWYLEVIKPRIYRGEGASKRAAQGIAAEVLEASLRLLHPFVPFATEEIWQRLAEALGRERFAASIMVAPFPQAEPARRDAEAERQMEAWIAMVREVRNIRAKLSLPPAKALRLVVTADDGADLDVARAGERFLKEFGRLEAVEVAPGLARPKASAAAVVERLRLYVPLEGVIDVAAERARLEDRLKKAEQQLEGARKKLANPGFTDRAPKDVVERTREMERDLAAQAGSIRASLAELE